MENRQEILKQIELSKSKVRTPEEVKKDLEDFKNGNIEIYNIFRKIENILNIK